MRVAGLRAVRPGLVLLGLAVPAALLVPVAPAHAAGVIQMFDCAPGNTANGLASLGMMTSGSCAFVQPGSTVNFPEFECTLDYVFRGSNGALYMGTAGHCTLGSPIGAVAVNNDAQPIGHLAFRVFNGGDVDVSVAQDEDFALIRLLPSDVVDPQVFDLGGPTGLYTGTSSHPVILRWVGQNLDQPPVQGTPAPAGVATAITRNGNSILFTGPALFGDSGAPVEIAGQAACVLTGIAEIAVGDPPWYGSPTPGHEIGEQWCTRLNLMLGLAERALHLRG